MVDAEERQGIDIQKITETSTDEAGSYCTILACFGPRPSGPAGTSAGDMILGDGFSDITDPEIQASLVQRNKTLTASTRRAPPLAARPRRSRASGTSR